MRIAKVDITNIMGIEALSFEPGVLTVLEGRNSSGKTSTLEAIRAALRGGHDPSLIRRGASEGSIRVVLGNGVEISKTIRPDASSLNVIHPETGRVSKAQGYIDSLVDSLGIDALSLVTCPPRQRAEYLAEVMPLEVTDDELKAAAGGKLPAGLRLPPRASALDRIEAFRRSIYDERTAVNRLAKDKRTTAMQLRQTLPPVAPLPDLASLRERKGRGETALVATERAVQAKLSGQLDGIRSTAQSEIDEVRADAAERIREIERERDASISRIKERAQNQAQEAKDSAASELRETAEKIRPELEQLAAEIARAEAEEREHVRAEKTREILARSLSEAEKAESLAKELSSALEGLEALKARTLAKMPIAGLEIQDGQVLVDGIPFDRVNRARQIQIALEVAKLRAKRVGLIVCDFLEALDDTTYHQFEDAALAAGLRFQVIGARVDDGDLRVRSVNPFEGAEAA